MVEPECRTLRAAGLAGLLCVASLGSAGAQEPPKPGEYGEVIDVSAGFVRFFLPADAPPPKAGEIEVVWKKKKQTVVRVVGGEDDPLELGLAVDRSASFHEAFVPLRAAALTLVDRGIKADDRLFSVAFTDRTQVLASGRGEARRVLEALPSNPEPGTHATAFFEAVSHSLGLFENADARAALVVVTDGCDTAGGLSRATSIAMRAEEIAVPVFLLMPDKEPCQYVRCEPDATGKLDCKPDVSPSIRNVSSSDMFNPALRSTAMTKRSNVEGATGVRDLFTGLITRHGGGAYVVKNPGEWQSALDRIFEQLSRQWTVVFEPTSDEVRSEEVRVYSTAGGRRRRLR